MGFTAGLIPAASYNSPTGVFVVPPASPYAGSLFITDGSNNLVRSVRIGPSSVSTALYFAGNYNPPALYNQQSLSLAGSNYNSLISSSGYNSLWIGEA